MPDREPATDSSDQQEAGTGYFAALAQARSILLTTFQRDGHPVSAPVRGVAAGDRAYFWAWGRSGSVRRLQQTDAVQVTPCSMRGLLTHGPPLDATARLLPREEASRAARELAREYPVQHRFLIPSLHWTRRRLIMHYELVADRVADSRGQCPEGSRAPDQRDGHSGARGAPESREFMRIRCARTHVTDHGIASIACIWPTPSSGKHALLLSDEGGGDVVRGGRDGRHL
jgi:hypothetical protein